MIAKDLFGCFIITCSICATISLANLPDVWSFRFLSPVDPVLSTDSFYYGTTPCAYLEPDRVSRAQYAWASRGECEYLFMAGGNPHNSTLQPVCTEPYGVNGSSRLGNDYEASPAGSSDECSSRCCGDFPRCRAWTYEPTTKVPTGKCISVDQSCCHLQDADSAPAQPSVPGTTSASIAVCDSSSIANGTDLSGGDYRTQAFVPSVEACQSLCCQEDECVAFVWDDAAPSSFLQCVKGQPCCYLKSSQPDSRANPSVSSGRINKPGKSKGATPPTGMRSAVPLGGLSTGNVELRADGSFRGWTVINQTPAGAAKFAWLNSTMAGLVVQGTNEEEGGAAASIRLPYATHIHAPESQSSVQPASSISYQGAHPLARLDVSDDRVQAMGIHGASLFGYSSWHPGDVNQSSRPAVVLSAGVRNDGANAKDVTGRFFFSLSVGLEDDMQRAVPHGGGKAVAAANPRECMLACGQSNTCASWTMAKGGSCMLADSVPENAFLEDSYSGVRGGWTASAQDGVCCLVRSTAYPGPTQGEIGLCFEMPTGESECEAGAIATGATLGDLWTDTDGLNGNSAAVNQLDPIAALAVPFTAPAGTNTTVDIVMAWSYPNRTWMGRPVGNAYAELYPTVHAAASSMLSARGVTLAKIQGTHETFFGSKSLPSTISDMLVNSLSHTRSLQWFEDRQWRQFEAMDCVNVDSVHNNQERHIPYVSFFSDVIRSNLMRWGQGQLPDGMIQEQLGCGCTSNVPEFDTPCGRVMSDVSSAYMMYVSEFLLWANDTDLAAELYPSVKKAAIWHMSVSNQSAYGYQPYKLQTTYDVLGLNAYPIATYSTAFHVMAMDVCILLATQQGDAELAMQCAKAKGLAQAGLDDMLWVDAMPSDGFDHGHYAAYLGNNKSVMADTFFGMTCAGDLGLSHGLAQPARAVEHLLTEQQRNDGPNGLVVMTGRDPNPNEPSVRDGEIWQMGSPNWASLMMRVNQTLKDTTGVPANVSVEEALAQPIKSLGAWRDLRDEWNVAGILGGPHTPGAGMPYITSHYGYFMSSWRVPLGLSGQLTDLRVGKESLSFAPQVDAPFSLPWFIPDAAGRIEATMQGSKVMYTLRLLVTGGAYDANGLTLGSLSVHGSSHEGSVHLSEGDSVSWTG